MKLFSTLFLLSTLILMHAPKIEAAKQSWWNLQAIDTMKFSRDQSREYLNDEARLTEVSDQQVKAIAQTGATHVVIDTPYDAEFLPVLRTWVSAARKYHLNVWFRGNWSGWEGWFGYPKISRDEHFQKTQAFLKENSDLFQDGDVFSACPECENGGPGDPRQNGDVRGHRDFLIKEYTMMTATFKEFHKNVQANFNSMNGDVARLVMDKPTTSALGGIVVVDHYVKNPTELNYDITQIAQSSGGKVILGEFGAPIPDINGTMTDAEQAAWLKQALQLLAINPDLVGLNYWTSVGGSTSIWNDKGNPKPAVAVLQSYFSPKSVVGSVTDTVGTNLDQVSIKTLNRQIASDHGSYQLTYLEPNSQVTVSADGYVAQTFTISELVEQPMITLVPIKTDLWYQIRIWLKNLFS